MSSDDASPSARIASASRAVEAIGGLLWLATIGVLMSHWSDDFDPLVFVTIGLAASAASAGLAGQRLGALGRLGRLGAGLAVLGGLLTATAAWPLVIFGLMGIATGTLIAAISLLRGQQRRRAAGLALLVAAVGAFILFGGRQWFPILYGVGHLVVATLGLATARGPRTGAEAGPRGGRRTLTGALPVSMAVVSAIAVVWLSAGLTSGLVRLPSGVTAAVRGGSLPALPIVVDTDMQPDDWMALLYLAGEPNVEIRAVTVAGGSSGGCELMVGIARDLLADVGRAGVPVACGPAPRSGGLPFPVEWTAPIRDVARSLGWSPDDGDPPGAAPDGGGAVALLRSAIAAGPVTILSLGPPTNIAALLEDRTWDRRNVVRVVQMAGAVDVPGNVVALPKVEWNAAVDPRALAAVLAGDVEVVLVSLDGTRHVPIRPADIDRLGADRSTRLAAIAARILASQRDLAASGGYFAWDQLAAVVARQPEVVRLEAIRLGVSTAPGEAGRTVRDAAGRSILVAVDADRAGFERIFLDGLLGRAK